MGRMGRKRTKKKTLIGRKRRICTKKKTSKIRTYAQTDFSTSSHLVNLPVDQLNKIMKMVWCRNQTMAADWTNRRSSIHEI